MLTANGNTVDALLARLEGVKETGSHKWQARCPAHDDSVASLSIGKGDNGGIVLKCHANCATADVVRAIGFEMKDLAPIGAALNGNGRREVAAYDYRDGEGTPISQAVRFEPKGFSQRNAAGEWTTKGCKVVPYRLPELIRSDPAEPVYVVEGEKDVDRLRSLGLVATCNAMGAGKWRSAHAAYLKGRHVVILPDNDEPGQQHAEQVEQSLKRLAASVCIVNLPDLPAKGDVSDWLNVKGNTVEELRKLVAKADAPRCRPILKLSLSDLREQHPRLAPVIIEGLQREGETGNIIAPAKFGKSWLVYSLAIAVNTGRHWLDRFDTRPGRVLIIDNELHPATIAHRIPIVGDAMGIHYGDYSTGIDVWALRGNLRSIQQLADDIEGIEPGYYKLIIYDAKYRFAIEGVSENDNAAEARTYNLFDQFGAHTLAAQMVIHHSTKGGQGEKRVTDVGAGAGSQSRAADCHVVLREHEDDGLAVLDAAVRSFPPLEPVALRWEFPLWVPDEWADAGKLKGKLTQNEQRQNDRDKAGVDSILKALLESPGTARELRPRTDLGKDRLQRLLDKLEFDGDIAALEITVRGNKCKQYIIPKDAV